MSDPLIDNKDFYQWELTFLKYLKLISRIIIILFFIGFFQSKPHFYVEFIFIVKIILALFLIYRFNSYRKEKIKFTELDRKVIYSSAIYIFVFSFIDIVNWYQEQIRNAIIPYTLPVVDKIKSLLDLTRNSYT